MKKLMALLMALMLIILAGCNSSPAPEATEAPVETTQAPAETTEAATEPTETEPPAPQTISGTILADKTPVLLADANREDVLDVVAEYDESYFVVKLENGYGLVEKRLVRLESQEAYVQWEGYAKYGAMLYPSYLLREEEGQSLSLNSRMLVLEDLGGILVVQTEEGIYYMDAETVSTHYVQPYSGGGGSADGGDITMGFQGGYTNLSVIAPQSGDVTGKATVLVEGAPILLGWFDREDAVAVVNEAGFAEEREGYYIVYLNGLYGYVRQGLIAREGEEPYAQWTGYGVNSPKLYSNYDLTGESVKLNNNAELQILADLGNCYLVVSGEIMGYMPKATVSEHPIVYSGWGGGGGGEWTPPAM